jgi:7,8-dihydroneopterin aldolase/epimerase/oxygenase
MPSHEITLKAMRFHALVGILPHERDLAQPIEIDVTARVTDGEGIVDYRRMYDATAAVFSAGPIDYLEEVAERVATRMFADHHRISSVRVAVRKPQVALGGPLAYAEVAVERTRDA